MERIYNYKSIEEKWQNRWKESTLYKTPLNATSSDKYYILPQLPYPSGEGLHVGHAEVYTACDIFARYNRMKGKKVLQVIGWDSFGLPAENYAIKTNIHPKISTEKAIENFKHQIQTLGVSVDWDRSISSHDPSFYKFTQWLFLLMFRKGLAYRKEQRVNWCDTCKTVLANEQVINGICERCENKTTHKEMSQWFFAITKYADRLNKDLDNLDWPKESIKGQKNWIGKTEGINIEYPVEDLNTTLTVYTTRPDTNYGATFIAIAPESNFVKENLEKFPNNTEVKEYIRETEYKSDLERVSDKTKTGVFSGLYAKNRLNNAKLPIYVSDFVLGSVGTGAVVGVPGSDTRDYEFAQSKNLPIMRVVTGENNDTSEIDTLEKVQTEYGVVCNSEFLNGLDSSKAIEKIIDYLEEKGWGKRAVNYKLRDWSVSRQRFWGSPIPIVYDINGKPHPVDEKDLPVLLPQDVDFLPTGESPLKQSSTFNKGVAEKYGKGWSREVDTLDTFVCSSWYYYRYLDPHNEKEFASAENLKTWMPVDFYLGGREHINGHLLYSRFVTKVLFDEGLIDFDEPFLKHRHQGTIWGDDGRIMSKRYGNVVNPTDVINEHGADTLRMFEMFLGPLEANKPWDTEGIKGISRFLKKIYAFAPQVTEEGEQGNETNILIESATSGMEEMRFNVVIAKLMETFNDYKITPPSKTSWGSFLKILAPFAPHLAEELWEEMGNKDTIHKETWPVSTGIKRESLKIPIEINGKLKGLLELPIDHTFSREEIETQAKVIVNDKLEGTEVVKIIYVENKLINFVTK